MRNPRKSAHVAALARSRQRTFVALGSLASSLAVPEALIEPAPPAPATSPAEPPRQPQPRAGRNAFDPLTPEHIANPHATFADLRRTCPLAHGERWGGFWLLSRYDDFVAVTRDHGTFVNSVQNVVPDEFRFDRPVKHLAFGNGIHKCPGEALARIELRVFIEQLLLGTRHFALDGPVELASWPEYGPKSLPLRFEVA